MCSSDLFARAMTDVIETGRYGLYHLVNQGYASRWDVACEIVRLMGKEDDIEVKPISSSEFPLPAPRPRSEMMRSVKLGLLGFDNMPHWKSSLKTYIDLNREKL